MALERFEPIVLVSDVALAVALAAILLLRRRASARSMPTRTWTMLAIATLVGLAFAVWARRVEPHFVEVTHESVPLSATPIRVVVLADLHAGRSDAAMLAHAVRLANDADPDVVLLGGDYITGFSVNEDNRAKLEGLRGLLAKRGVFAVFGNHDSEPFADTTPRREALAAILASFGYRVLRNEAVELSPDLWLAGVDEELSGHANVVRALAAVPDGARRVVIAHNWRALDAPVRIDLAIAAHTHGGQVCVPYTHLCGGRSELPYLRGRYDWMRGGVLYVNRGIGMSKLPIRFAARPEITVFELGPEPRGPS